MTPTLKLHLFFSLHYIKIPEANYFCDALHYGYIKNCFRILNVITSSRPLYRLCERKGQHRSPCSGQWGLEQTNPNFIQIYQDRGQYSTTRPVLRGWSPCRCSAPTLHKSRDIKHPVPEKLHFSYIKIFWEINFPKITLDVFACDSENYVEKIFGSYFLGKSHFSYKKVFRIHFAIISGWSVHPLLALSCKVGSSIPALKVYEMCRIKTFIPATEPLDPLRGQSKDPSNPLQNPFKTPSKRLQEPFENLSRRCRKWWYVRLPRA